MMAQLILDGKEPQDDINLFAIDRLATGRLVDGEYANKILGSGDLAHGLWPGPTWGAPRCPLLAL